MERPTVSVFADPNPLSVSLTETLLSNFCKVKVLSKNKEGWIASTRHLRKNSLLEFSKEKSPNFDYALFISSYFNEKPETTEGERKRAAAAVDLAKINKAKCLLVFPYIQNPCSNRAVVLAKGALRRGESELGIVYLGELFGPRMFLDERDRLSRILRDLVLKKQVLFDQGETPLFPAYIPDISRALVKSLFSFGYIGEEA